MLGRAGKGPSRCDERRKSERSVAPVAQNVRVRQSTECRRPDPMKPKPECERPCDRWSPGNRLLLAAGTEDARGYRQWQEVGRDKSR